VLAENISFAQRAVVNGNKLHAAAEKIICNPMTFPYVTI
jgi:uncharacterized protein (DUF2062 family)